METLHADKKLDRFEHESPIRAFTDWKVDGLYAVGKGFRPSLAHTATYMNAMEAKEGWRLVQILEAETQTPSFVFRRDPVTSFIFHTPDDSEFRRKMKAWIEGHEPDKRSEEQRAADDAEELRTGSKRISGIDAMRKIDQARTVSATLDDVSPEHLAAFMGVPTAEIEAQDSFSLMKPREPTLTDDPVNPRHYGGTSCAEIGERLSANSYQVLKYNWRLGKKDNACVEIDKSLWYLAREIEIAKDQGEWQFAMPTDDWFVLRLEGQSSYVRLVARKLIDWCRHGDITSLITLRGLISTHRSTFTCPEFGRQLEA